MGRSITFLQHFTISVDEDYLEYLGELKYWELERYKKDSNEYKVIFKDDDFPEIYEDEGFEEDYPKSQDMWHLNHHGCTSLLAMKELAKILSSTNHIEVSGIMMIDDQESGGSTLIVIRHSEAEYEEFNMPIHYLTIDVLNTDSGTSTIKFQYVIGNGKVRCLAKTFTDSIYDINHKNQNPRILYKYNPPRRLKKTFPAIWEQLLKK
jgi:hypothetical protein